MRTLKLLVIGMGIVIVVATAALVTIIVQRAGKLASGSASSPAVSRSTGEAPPIAVPEGFRVVGTELAGDRLLVRLEGRAPGAANDEVRLMTVDLERGTVERTIRLVLPGATPSP
jgi:hypothetical protein